MPAALGDHQALTGLDQVANHFLSRHVDHRGANRHRQDQILALGAGAVGAAALLAILRVEFTRVAVIDQGIEVGGGLEEYRATVATVAAVGATLLDEFLATEGHHAVTAVTGFYKNRNFVDKFHGYASRKRCGSTEQRKGPCRMTPRKQRGVTGDRARTQGYRNKKAPSYGQGFSSA